MATIWRQDRVGFSQAATLRLPPQLGTNLIQLEGNHGDCMEDSSCRASDGSNSLRAGALRDGDPGTALQVWNKHWAAGIFPAVGAGICLPLSPGPSQEQKLPFWTLTYHIGGVIQGNRARSPPTSSRLLP